MIKIIREIYLIPIYLYKGLISPISPPTCRYSPSCSSYFLLSVKKHGIFKGTIMGIMRIIRCRNKFFGGFDPVPEKWDYKALKNEFIVRKKPKNFDKEFKNNLNN